MIREVLLIAATGVACGRAHFDPLATSDARGVDGGADGRSVVSPSYVASIERGTMANVVSDTFMWQASAVGNAVLMAPACAASQVPTLTVTAPGWTFEQLAPVGTAGGIYATVFGAIAPNTTPVQVTVDWGVTCMSLNEIGDELAGNDPTGGATTFEVVDQQAQVADCSASLTTVRDDSLVWTSCTSAGLVTAVPTGYTKAGDDGSNDWTAYKIVAMAGTLEAPTWQSGGVIASITALVAVKPR